MSVGELLRCAVLFFPSLSGCQVSVICEMKAVICAMAYPLSRCQFLLLATAPCSLLRVMFNGCVAPYRWWYSLVVWWRFEEVKPRIAREGLLRRTTIEINSCSERMEQRRWGSEMDGWMDGQAYKRREIVCLMSRCGCGGIGCWRLAVERLM